MRWIIPVVAVLLIGGSCGDDGEAGETTTTTASTTTELAETPSSTSPVSPSSFSFATDDLCEWVTGDEVLGFVTAAGFDVKGPVTAGEPSTEDTTGWDCAWMFASGEELQLGVRDRPALGTIVDYQEPGQIMEVGATVSGHPALSDGVVVENGAFLRFGFYTPGTDEVLNVVFWTEDAGNEEGYEAVVMAVADSVLSDLGWVSGADETTTGMAEATSSTSPASSSSAAHAVGAIYPWHASGIAHTDPVDAVREFVEFVGFKQDAALGEFQRGDSRSGEVQIGPPPWITTAFVRLDAADNWVVIGAESGAIVVDAPVPDAVVSSPLATHFEYKGFGDGVVLELWAAGVAEPLVDEMLTSGTGVFAADVWDVTVEWSSEVTGPATAIFTAIGQPVGNLSGVPTDERVDGVTAFGLELSS